MEYIWSLINFFRSLFFGETPRTDEHLPLTDPESCNQKEDWLENPQMREIMLNPIQALEKHEALRNLVTKHDPSLKLWFDRNGNEFSNVHVPSNSLGAIQLEEKIKISPINEETNTVKVLLIGMSGCGQTTLLGYLTGNEGFKGADTMFAQNFEANAFDIKIGEVGFEIKLTESPGMCGGIELEELGCHWKDLIKTINETGGVGVFMLLIKSNERILYEFFEEFETFSAQYVEDTELFWKRTIVIFTSIDELKGCNTYEERVERLQTQINGRGMEKMKNIIDQTQKGPLFVSSVKKEYREQFKQSLSIAISEIVGSKVKNIIPKSDNEAATEEICLEKKDLSSNESCSGFKIGDKQNILTDKSISESSSIKNEIEANSCTEIFGKN